MKRILAALLLFSVAAFGADKDIRVPQYNATTGAWPSVTISPAANSLVGFGSDKTLANITAGFGLTITGNVITVTAVPTPVGNGGKYLFSDGAVASWQPVSGSGVGSVSSVSIVTANGVSGSVANATTIPAITLSLGAITPLSVTAQSGQSLTLSGAANSMSMALLPATSAAVGNNSYLRFTMPTAVATQSATFPIWLVNLSGLGSPANIGAVYSQIGGVQTDHIMSIGYNPNAITAAEHGLWVGWESNYYPSGSGVVEWYLGFNFQPGSGAPANFRPIGFSGRHTASPWDTRLDFRSDTLTFYSNHSGSVRTSVYNPSGTWVLNGTSDPSNAASLYIPDATNATSAGASGAFQTTGGGSFGGNVFLGGTLFVGSGVGVIQGGAGNFTFTAGTGASRSITFRTTTSGSVAFDTLVLDGDGNATVNNNGIFGGALLSVGSNSANGVLKAIATTATYNVQIGNGVISGGQGILVNNAAGETTDNFMFNIAGGGVWTSGGGYKFQRGGSNKVTFDKDGIVTALSYTSGAPNGGTAAAWKFGVVSVTSPTSPNRTIELDVAGTIYYLAAKTTNN